MSNKLGDLSAKYESGPKGSAAIGWDKTGGTSYGKYQIASKTGTFAQFVEWCMKQDKLGQEVGLRLTKSKPWDTGGTKGTCPTEWKMLVEEKKIQELEHRFIEVTQFHPSLSKLESDLHDLIISDWILCDVYWSTVVQHGVGGARSLVTKVWNSLVGKTKEELVKGIYTERGTRFKSSSSTVQESVKARFKDECDKALRALVSGSY